MSRAGQLQAGAATTVHRMKTFDTIAELAACVGQEVAVSDWITITQQQVNLFAEATGDHQWIHVDVERAQAGPFGAPIAHGFLTLSLIPVLSAMTEGARVSNVKMGVNYGGNKTRFISPVRAGKRVRAHVKLLDLTEKRPGQWQQTNEYTIEIEGEDKPALIAEWVMQFFV